MDSHGLTKTISSIFARVSTQSGNQLNCLFSLLSFCMLLKTYLEMLPCFLWCEHDRIGEILPHLRLSAGLSDEWAREHSERGGQNSWLFHSVLRWLIRDNAPYGQCNMSFTPILFRRCKSCTSKGMRAEVAVLEAAAALPRAKSSSPRRALPVARWLPARLPAAACFCSVVCSRRARCEASLLWRVFFSAPALACDIPLGPRWPGPVLGASF